MTDDQWRRIWDLYEAVHALPPGEIRAYLQSAAADAEIVREVEAILAGREPQPKPPEWPHVGEKLGRYEVLEPLGRGGTGEVYSGRDTALGRPVALKFVSPEFAGVESVARRFFREAQAASALNHPNIVTVYEVAESPSSPVVVMELVEGVPLRKLCGKPMPAADVKRLGVQIAQALAAAHQRGIVHRDLKPENAMLRPDGYVKILDFGLARQLTGSGAASLTSTHGLGAGTLRYMAPEQCKGEAATTASDVFALGLMLYEMTAGSHPFEAGTALDTAHGIVWDEPKPLANATADLRGLLHSMLAKDPAARPSSAEVAQRLAPEPIATQPLTPPSESSRRWLIGGAAAAGAAFLATRFRRSQSRPGLAVLLTNGEVRDPVFSPDGKRLAFAWKQPGDTAFHLFLISASGGVPVQLTRSSANEIDPAWSPDGSRLSFMRQGSGESALYVIPVESGRERRVTTAFFREYSGRAVWLSNQALVLSDLPESKLFQVDVENGKRRPILEPPPPTGDTIPLLSPDGKWLSFSRFFNQTASDVFVIPSGGGSPRRLTFDEHAKREMCWAPDGRGILYRMRTNYYGLWYVGLDGSRPHEVQLPFEPLGRFDVKPGTDGGWMLAIGETSSVESIWRAEIPAGAGQSASPVRFISSGQRSVDVNPVISPDGLRVAFVSTRTGSPEIWVSDSEGKRPRQLTSFGGVEVSCPAWSSDGSRIVSAARVRGTSDIFFVDAEAAGPPIFLETKDAEETEPQFSHDGLSIVFTSKHNLWRAPVGGGPPRQLTHHVAELHRASRDGRWIYFVRAYQPGLWRIPSEGGDEQLVLDRIQSELYRGWALGSNAIYYTVRDAAAGKWTILLYDPKTRTDRAICRLDLPLPRWTGTLSVSRDERWMVFPLHEPGNSRLAILDGVRA